MLKRTFSSEELSTLSCEEILKLVATGKKSLIKTFRMKKISLFSRVLLWFFWMTVYLSHCREVRRSKKTRGWCGYGGLGDMVSYHAVSKWPASIQSCGPKDTAFASVLVDVRCNPRFGEMVRVIEFLRETFPGRLLFIPVNLNVFEVLAPYVDLLNECRIVLAPVYSPSESDPDELQQIAQKLLCNALEKSALAIGSTDIFIMSPLVDFEFNPDVVSSDLLVRLQDNITRLTTKTLYLSSKTGKDYKTSLFRHYFLSLRSTSL